ncbi:putative protein phosphatase 2C 47 [Iris pallida]|uniref:protein-serine/threonine phosphatase n=1 Tax=Iris pallida TaxID=29817 RepID=A0AAX6FNR7_IRIPA|nr:putative protein phosphatase 2C 47 [Iris pallida]KAJ6832269.1 putative protein phosphatase 2C 47 [Iris pallida]
MAAEIDFTPAQSTGLDLDVGCSISDNLAASAAATAKHSRPSKPPRPVLRHCTSTTNFDRSLDSDLDIGPKSAIYSPVFRSGSCAEIGPKRYMEDEHICIDSLEDLLPEIATPAAFYGVFDGHGGTDAALFVRENILKFIAEDTHFQVSMEKAMKSAFLRTDHAFADASSSLDSSSGTTALTAIIFGRSMHVANAGDCRAILGRRGRAVELSRDHKPSCSTERLRIESLGGAVYDGYLNGQLSVARAIGDWHMKGAKGSACPLSAEPEIQEATLTEEDEFLIMGCDGLWDVMSSQCAVTIARRELMAHNDPERCSRELVREAIRRNTCDNLTVVVVCFSPDPPPRIEIPKNRFRRSISAESLNFLKEVLDSN